MKAAISGRTIESAQELGLYESVCCGQELLFDRNECFGACPRCEELCEWRLIESVISMTHLEEWSDVGQEERP